MDADSATSRSFLAASKSSAAYLLTLGSDSADCTADLAVMRAALGCGVETQAPSANARPSPISNFAFMDRSLLSGLRTAHRFLTECRHAGIEFRRCFVRPLLHGGSLGELRVGVGLFGQHGRRLRLSSGCGLLRTAQLVSRGGEFHRREFRGAGLFGPLHGGLGDRYFFVRDGGARTCRQTQNSYGAN